jgi:hypothetical protein
MSHIAGFGYFSMIFRMPNVGKVQSPSIYSGSLLIHPRIDDCENVFLETQPDLRYAKKLLRNNYV